MLCIVVLSGGEYFIGTNVFSRFSLWEPTGALRESGALYREVFVWKVLGAIRRFSFIHSYPLLTPSNIVTLLKERMLAALTNA